MKKTYIVEEVIHKTYELEGTELEIQDEIERIMSDSVNIEKDPDYYSYEAKEIGTFDDQIQNYLDSFTPKWAREDLEGVLANDGIPPTEENLKRFMELNPVMEGIKGCFIEDWFERMHYLIDEEKYELAAMKWDMDGMIVEIRLNGNYLAEEVDEYSEVYEIWVDGRMKWNYLTLDNAEGICEGIGYRRNVEVLK